MSSPRFETGTSHIRIKTLGAFRLLLPAVLIFRRVRVVGGKRLLASSCPSVHMNQSGSEPDRFL